MLCVFGNNHLNGIRRELPRRHAVLRCGTGVADTQVQGSFRKMTVGMTSGGKSASSLTATE
jgi:hypothetical protein